MDIPIVKLAQEFDSHLKAAGNNRIILSGRFGSGKTYFIDKYFNARKNDFETIHLYPVNYSVASNEDVFELIKYDILLELLSLDNVKVDEISFSNWDGFLAMLMFEKPKLAEAILDVGKEGIDVVAELHAPSLGLKPSKVVDAVIKLIKIFKKKSEELTKATDYEKIKSFIAAQKKNKGSIYEEDAITILIGELLKQLKSNNKTTALVIDDLDRMDPGHIFRILNVLAAHIDVRGSSENKFGFGKIILVCHYENIREIFHHVYGKNTDFDGYMDKFYSSDIFESDNAQVLKEYVWEFLKKLNISAPESLSPYLNFLSDEGDLETNKLNKSLMSYLLQGLILSGQLTIRKLEEKSKGEYNFSPKPLIFDDGQSFDSNNLPGYIRLELLKWILGDGDSLRRAFESAAVSKRILSLGRYKFEISKALGEIIPLLGLTDHFVSPDVKQFNHNDSKTHFFLTWDNPGSAIMAPSVIRHESYGDTTHFMNSNGYNIFAYYADAIRILQSHGLLK